MTIYLVFKDECSVSGILRPKEVICSLHKYVVCRLHPYVGKPQSSSSLSSLDPPSPGHVHHCSVLSGREQPTHLLVVLIGSFAGEVDRVKVKLLSSGGLSCREAIFEPTDITQTRCHCYKLEKKALCSVYLWLRSCWADSVTSRNLI